MNTPVRRRAILAIKTRPQEQASQEQEGKFRCSVCGAKFPRLIDVRRHKKECE